MKLKKFLSWFALALAILGATINAQGSIYGFVFWEVSNLYWLYDCWHRRDVPMGILFFYYSCLNIYGIFHWHAQDLGS